MAGTVWVCVLFVLVAGSRHLLTRGVPAVGEMVDFGESSLDLLRSWVSGWRTAGLGSPSPNPSGLGLLGTLGFLFFGALGLLRTVLILGMLPLGAFFAYRLPRPTGSRWAQIVCLLVYVAVPLPYNALANGRWDARGPLRRRPPDGRDARPGQSDGAVRSTGRGGRAGGARTPGGATRSWVSASSRPSRPRSRRWPSPCSCSSVPPSRWVG